MDGRAGPHAPLSRGQRGGSGAVLHRARRALLVGQPGGPAGADRHGRHRGRDHLPGSALSGFARPLRALRRRTLRRARADDAAALLRARHRGAGDGGGDALRRLAPPARLDRQSRCFRAGHRRRPARSADRRRPPAPHRAHQPRGARAPGAGRRRARPVDGVPPAPAAGRHRRAAGDRRRRQLRRPRPDRRRARAVGPARARHDRPSAPPAARGGRRLAGAGRAARHDGAQARRAHARRFRGQRQPRAQDADRGPRRLHRDPARPGARRCERARALPGHHGRAGRPHAPPGRRSPDAVAHRAARACPPRRRDRSRAAC